MMDPSRQSVERNRMRVLWGVLGLIVVVRLVSLGLYPLFDKTEARYAFIGALMLRTGNWITPLIDFGVPFWAKPPLSVWGTALAYAAFGVNAFAARLPSFLFVAGAGLLTWQLAASQRDRGYALVAACIFASCGLVFYLAGGVMTDPALLLGTTLTMVAFWQCMARASRPWGYAFFVALAVSLLAKGPIGVVLPGIAIGAWVLWHNAWRAIWRNVPWISGTLLMLALAVPWYVLAERATPGFLNYFIVGEHFQRFLVKDWQGDLYGGPRVQPYGAIWFFGLLATLPWSLLLLAAPFWPRLRGVLFSRALVDDPWLSYLLLWNLASLVFFSFARAMLITYVAMGLPGFALLLAHLLRASGLERGRLVPALAALVPVAALAALAAMQVEPLASRLPTQRDIIALYEAQRSGPGYALFYIWEKPYSADLLSRARARLARDPAQVSRLLQAGGDPYFAVDRSRYDALPADLRARLEPVAERNATLLLRPKRSALPSTPRPGAG